MAEVISVVSGKGGVGKTLLAASLGISFAKKGKKTLLIDGDMGLRSLDIVLGLESESLYHFWDLAQGKCFAQEAILKVNENLDFLPGTVKEGWNELFSGSVDAVIEDVSALYDVVILDCPAGIGFELKEAEKYSHKILVVMAPLWTSKRSAERLLLELKSSSSVFFILNRMKNIDKIGISFKELYNSINQDLFLAAIPYSIKAEKSYQSGNLSEFIDLGAFSNSINKITDYRVYGKTTDFDIWEKILNDAEKENINYLKKEIFLKSEPKIYNKSKIYAGTNYKWRRRRW